MLFRKKKELLQNDTEAWKAQWQSLVPPECRNVPITVGGETVIAFVQINQFVMMLQDGLLMEATFFDVCDHFARAGYHVIWLMRCTQDIHNGYLKQKSDEGTRKQWLWRRPTTNFGRWTSDNFGTTILLQHRPIPETGLSGCEERILERVIWTQSDDSTRMIPGRSEFFTTDTPGTPMELQRWLSGMSMSALRT